MPLADGQVYAGYTILRKLGEGGMGMVYLAQHPRLPRRDALKVLPAALTVDDEYRRRFNRESEIAATLWHPHIVEVHDRGELEGRLWISMDYVDGTLPEPSPVLCAVPLLGRMARCRSGTTSTTASGPSSWYGLTPNTPCQSARP